MALRGNLRDFSLPDVFQLVQLSGKTGVLRIAGPETEGSIWFRDGEVFFAQSNWRREQLGERLVAAQRITPAALARALELRESEAEGGRRLGEILVNEGYITQQVLETFVQEQIQDTIFDIMRWDEGDFDFEVLPSVVHEDIGLSVSVENIVMEGSRRLEEWQRIKKKVPSTDMVFKMATAPGEGTFEISLKPVEWALLLLIDGTRSVRELAVETHSTDFDVARVVYGLFSAGLLEVPTDEEIERLRADRARREDKRAKLDAERAAREQAQMDEALDLEAQLAARSEARRSASEAEGAPAAEAAPEPAVAPEPEAAPEPEVVPGPVPEMPRHEPEEPEFLASAGETPSQDDMAVFEQMMASVLSPQAPGAEETAPPAAQEEPGVAPAPVIEPDEGEAESPIVPGFDFMPELAPELGLLGAAEAAPEPGPADLVPGVDFFAGETAPGFEAEVAPSAVSGEELPSDGSVFDGGADYVQYPPVAEPEAAPVTGDFETDLRSLGLGEYPEELLQAGVSGADLLAPETPPAPEVAGMADDFAEYGLGAGLLEPEPGAGPEEIAAPPAEIPGYEVPADAQAYELPAEARVPMSEIEAGRADEPSAAGEDADLDSLLASLGSGDGGSTGTTSGVISSDTEFGTEEASDGGYISTDAFLAEFDDSSLSSGLGDELTALTGGAAAGRSNRPVATVNKLPEAGEGQILHRDQMVDRSLLEKIIEGIENL